MADPRDDDFEEPEDQGEADDAADSAQESANDDEQHEEACELADAVPEPCGQALAVGAALAASSSSSSAASSSGSSAAAAGLASAPVDEACRLKAEQEIAAEMQNDAILELIKMREKAEQLREHKTVSFLDQRIYELRKRHGRPHADVSVYLRQKALERTAVDTERRLEGEAVRLRTSKLAQEEKTAKRQVEAAKHESAAAQAALKLQMEKLKEQRLEENQKAAGHAAFRLQLRKHGADRLASRCLKFTLFEKNLEQLAALDAAVKDAVSRRLGRNSCIIPDFMDHTRPALRSFSSRREHVLYARFCF
jgi:hypothetical protein